MILSFGAQKEMQLANSVEIEPQCFCLKASWISFGVDVKRQIGIQKFYLYYAKRKKQEAANVSNDCKLTIT